MSHIRKLVSLIIAALFLAAASLACKCEILPPLDSLSQLNQYDFVALVKITGDKDYQVATRDQESIGQLHFSAIEIFKGYSTGIVLEYLKNSSCDMGIDTGEEWLLFAKITNGKLAIFPCDRNQLYQDTSGLKDWQYGRGINDLKKLRKLYNHPITQPGTERFVRYYPNGQMEIEASYVNGLLQGKRTIWYPDGKIYGRETYFDDSLKGKAEWYYPTGQLSYEAYYSKGKHVNVSRFYFRDNDWKSGTLPPSYETIYDTRGREILFRQYYPPGQLKQESIYEPDSKFQTVIHYHDNGNVSFMGYYKNYRPHGEHWEYSKEGVPLRSWLYDKNGRQVK